jgi:hypothetical protein
MATIKITATDNELYLIAYQGGNSYPLAHITSGYNNGVDVTLNLQKGQYSGPAELIGLAGALSASSGVFLDAGDYSLVAIGVNWGGAIRFAVSLDNTTLAFADTSSKNRDGTVAIKVTQPAKLTIS